jgi:ligand-binding sensor domain-containing protein
MRTILQAGQIIKRHNITNLCLLIFFFFGIPFSGFGQRSYLFENISIPEGLSNSGVQFIFQDSNGFLWISTSDGLNRYDGYTMKVFKNDPNDSTTLPNNYCSAITEDSDGFIWIGVFGNIIARFNPIDESFKRIPIETGGVTNISEYPAALTDADGNIWFGTTNHGMLRLNRSTSRFEKVSLDTTQSDNANWGQISAIIELKNGNILASDYGSGIKIYNKNLDLFQSFYLKANYSPAEIGVIFEDDAGNIWFGGKSLLIKYSPSYYMVENYDIFSDFQIPTKYDFITGIEQDADGYIWVGIYSQGLYRINQNTKAVGKFEYTSDKSTSGQDVLWTLFRDRYGVIWIGTWYGGLYKFDPLREPFTYTKLKVPEILNSGTNYVTAISGSQQRNEITVGTSARGLFSYNPETKKTTHLNLKFDPATLIDGLTNIQSLCVDDLGNTYLSYNNLGLYGFGEDHVIYSIKSPHWGKTSSYIANTMKMDLAGNIWIASRHGFEKFNPVTSEFSLLPTIMNKQMSKDLKSAVKTISETRQSIASILKVGEASNAEKKFSLSQDQKVLVICLGEGRMVQGNDVLFDTGSLMTGDGRLLWSMNDLSKTFNDGGGFKNRIAVKCIDLKQGDYKITFSSDVGHSYGNYNVTAPPDSQWWGIQVFKIDDSEQSNISELNEQEIQSDRYMPMEIGTSIEISKRIYNVLWLGSMNNSFFKYDLVTGDFKQYNYDTKNKFSPNNSITCIFEDREGIVWIATLNTLIRFDPVTEKIVKFDQKDGLPSNLIN